MKAPSACCAPDCNTAVASGLYFCPDCWALVPQGNREAMREAYRPLIELNLPLNRAVLVSKHRDTVLAAARAIVRPVTAPEPEIHLCAGAEAPAPLDFMVYGFNALELPLLESMMRLAPRVRNGALKLLTALALAPCWAMGLAPTRDAALSFVARVDAADALDVAMVLTPGEWAEALAALIRAGAVVERLYGRARSA